MGREAQGSELFRVAGFPPLGRSGDLDSPGDGQMKSRTHRVTLADLTKSSEFRTKEDLQWAAQFIASNSELLGEVDPELLAKIDEMADESDSECGLFSCPFFHFSGRVAHGSLGAEVRGALGIGNGGGTGCCRLSRARRAGGGEPPRTMGFASRRSRLRFEDAASHDVTIYAV